MASPPSGPQNPSNPCPICPVCDGVMELVYDRFNQRVCICIDCHAGITIPSSAYEVIRLKREKKWSSQG